MGKEKFAKNTVYLLALLIIIILTLNFLYIKLVIPEKVVYKQNLAYEEFIENSQDNNIQFAFMGDSHVYSAFDPLLINNSFNFGTSGESYPTTYFKLRKLLKVDKVNISNVVLELDLHTFAIGIIKENSLMNEYWLYSNYASFREISEITDRSIINLFIEAYLPVIGKGEEFYYAALNRKSEEIYMGWRKTIGNYSLLNTTEDAKFTYKSLFEGGELIDEHSWKYFLKTLELARDNNLNIIIINYPHTKEFNEYVEMQELNRTKFYEEIFLEVDKILNKKYFVLDYYNLYFNQPDYFRNSDHLNYIGGRNLTLVFAKDINYLA